jgi:hypothetical protein
VSCNNSRYNQNQFNFFFVFTQIPLFQYYITTSNWTPDYFEATAGVSLTMISTMDNWQEMDNTFDEDWNSPYTMPIFQRLVGFHIAIPILLIVINNSLCSSDSHQRNNKQKQEHDETNK